MKDITIPVSRTSGKGRGKKMGIPTINFKIPPELSLPHGIYGGWLIDGTESYPAAIHFGPRPVFHEEDPSLEAYLLDPIFPDLSEKLMLQFTTYIRPIKSFPTTNEMLTQIEKDVTLIKNELRPKLV